MHLLGDLMCARLTCTHLSPPGGDESIKKELSGPLVFFYHLKKTALYFFFTCGQIVYSIQIFLYIL